MFKLQKLFILFLLSSAAITVHAENLQSKKMQLDINLLLIGMDAGGNDNFHSSQAIAVHYNYYIKDWLAADVGFMSTARTLDESRRDIVGDYRASLQTSAILFGVKPRYKFSTPYDVYSRIGLLYWRTELEVEEFFAEGIPGGQTSATDKGTGYYLSIGGSHYITDNVIVQLELRHMKQLDVFEGKSKFPFDLTINALSLGLGYLF